MLLDHKWQSGRYSHAANRLAEGMVKTGLLIWLAN